MRRRARHRNLVVLRQSADPVSAWGPSSVGGLARATGARRGIHVGALLTLIGLMGLARGVRARWRPILAVVVFTAPALMVGSGAWGMLFFAGICWLLHALVTPARPDADRRRRSELQHELAGYRSPAQWCDLAATLDRYPDGMTCELRDVLANQALTV